jgi:hypothetical protein
MEHGARVERAVIRVAAGRVTDPPTVLGRGRRNRTLACGSGGRRAPTTPCPCDSVFRLSKSKIKTPPFEGRRLEKSGLFWILPAPAAPWIRGHTDAIGLPAHEYATRPVMPFAARFGFGESQHRTGTDGWILTSGVLLTGQVP